MCKLASDDLDDPAEEDGGPAHQCEPNDYGFCKRCGRDMLTRFDDRRPALYEEN